MSTPDFEKPFAPPGGTPPDQGQPAGYGAPQYGAPPPYGQAPYGQAPSGQAGGAGVVAPDGSWVGPPLASWGLRLGGYLIDSVISIVITVVVGLISNRLGDVAGLVVFLVYGYLTGTTGQTPGRQVVGVRVLKIADGQVLGPGLGIARQFCHFLDALPLLLGFFWPLWDKKNQTFADKIVSSVVVKV